jgi:hypothetical protein
LIVNCWVNLRSEKPGVYGQDGFLAMHYLD